MQFFPNASLAFAIISSGLLFTTLARAVPTPQMAALGKQEGQSMIETRQCLMSPCGDKDDHQDMSSMMARQVMSHPVDQGDIENRQTMLSMGADEGDVQSRQIHGGLTVEDGEVENMHMAKWGMSVAGSSK